MSSIYRLTPILQNNSRKLTERLADNPTFGKSFVVYRLQNNLASKSYKELRRLLSIKTKLLGQILQEADLISSFQLETALLERVKYPDLRIGEILVQNGAIDSQTADFFVQDWSNAIVEPEKNALGYYLERAGILNSEQIEVILAEQRATGVRFGTVAVFQGFLKSTTLDFFLANLFPEEIDTSPFIDMYSSQSLNLCIKDKE